MRATLNDPGSFILRNPNFRLQRLHVPVVFGDEYQQRVESRDVALERFGRQGKQLQRTGRKVNATVGHVLGQHQQSVFNAFRIGNTIVSECTKQPVNQPALSVAGFRRGTCCRQQHERSAKRYVVRTVLAGAG